jgi:hypothetical protein
LQKILKTNGCNDVRGYVILVHGNAMVIVAFAHLNTRGRSLSECSLLSREDVDVEQFEM